MEYTKGRNVSLTDWFSQMHTKVGHVCHVLYAMSRWNNTHPVIWKNPNILPFVNKICGEETIHLDSCTCWNYGDMCMDVMRKHTSRPNLQARVLYYRHCVRVQTWPHYLRTMSVQNVLLFVSSITVHFTK